MADLGPDLERFYLTQASDSLNQIILLGLDHYLSATLAHGSFSSNVSKVLICFLTVCFTVNETYDIPTADKTLYTIAYVANFSQTIGAILYQSTSSNNEGPIGGVWWTIRDILQTLLILRFLRCQLEIIAQFLVLAAFARSHGALWLLQKTGRLLQLQIHSLIQTPTVLAKLALRWTLRTYAASYSGWRSAAKFAREGYQIWSALVPVMLMEIDRARGDLDTDEEQDLKRARRRLRRIVQRIKRRFGGAGEE
ncbi:MAG: hypothetical protein OHK93_006799 [Ramalina farinacea]|uniref:Uncharacterized protein n=1 Tax=Ramalina farinacea TaxID=258253 RepID=A0AA43TTU8_9LECA|nr:hypothetical protein [Ramalina farinacea]